MPDNSDRSKGLVGLYVKTTWTVLFNTVIVINYFIEICDQYIKVVGIIIFYITIR
jgi:hypothetical protein